MNIIYHIPHPEALNAYRTIYVGFKNAFEELGHTFVPYTADDSLELLLDKEQPDIFFTSTHFYYQKFLDFAVLQKHRDRGMKVFVKVDFWDSPLNKGRINEAKSLKDDTATIDIIRSGRYGDVFYHVVEQGDVRMQGFEDGTGYPFYTIPLAADSITLKGEKKDKFAADISFIGTYLPQKREYFQEYVFPLRNQYNLQLYGQDWTRWDRTLGFIQKCGQYFNIPGIKSLRRPKLQLLDEGYIYASSVISINVHEDYQRKYGGDCNERTFKIPFCNGFEITDDVACIRKYFEVDKEIIVAENSDDWFEKIQYYISNPDQRLEIMKAGKSRVMKDHTYINRAQQLLALR